MTRREEVLAGVLLGTAVGDAIGLPYEGLSRRRVQRLLGDRPLQHRFVLGRGLLSDDTEHACLVAQALLASQGDPERFARSLAWRLRGWVLALPAGIGFATLRALLKLLCGVSPERSGVRSAGNGAAMRSAVLGVCLGDTPRMRAALHRGTRITHTDPRAYEGALAVALAACRAADSGTRLDPAGLLAGLLRDLRGPALRAALERARRRLAQGARPAEFADELGLDRGVTGFVDHTVPCALYCWLRAPHSPREAIESAVRLGGDTDTVAAIVGALAGATQGASGLPQDWLAGLIDWPRSPRWIRGLAVRLAAAFPQPQAAPAPPPNGAAPRPLPLLWPAIPLRNALFLALVLAHGARRLLPPW
ncbi:MAG: ADP-ribosylglycohydrolase [Planctomycetota bacterium]|nr:MAG: ADP-ribosylglycohydrolase [Planctomycetota bacterium]